MQDTVHELFPDYLKNKSLMSDTLYREPIKLIDMPVTAENLESYNDAWKKIVEVYGESL